MQYCRLRSRPCSSFAANQRIPCRPSALRAIIMGTYAHHSGLRNSFVFFLLFSHGTRTEWGVVGRRLNRHDIIVQYAQITHRTRRLLRRTLLNSFVEMSLIKKKTAFFIVRCTTQPSKGTHSDTVPHRSSYRSIGPLIVASFFCLS